MTGAAPPDGLPTGGPPLSETTPAPPRPSGAADAAGGPISPNGAGRDELRVEGIGVAPGVTVGEAYLYAGGGYQAEPEHLDADAVEAELGRFERAVARSERELKKVGLVARQKLGAGSAGIFDAQALILRDPQFYDAVAERIRDGRQGAGWAVQSVMEALRRRLESSPSAALRERAADFLDVQDRVLRNLQQGRAVSRIDRDRVVVAERLSAADVLLFSRHGVLAVVMDFGGPTSHVAIMARALGVPAVVSLHGLAGRVEAGDTVVVDGFSGTVTVRPTGETRAAAEAKAERFARLSEDRAEVAAAPSETRDGHAVALQANVEFREEFPLLHEYGAEGIGLFRTEMLFLTQGRALDEAQQHRVYRDAVVAAAPHAVTFRLLDLGGDKVLPMSRREANPALGWRGLRILLDKPDLLRPQLRALLRAAVEAPDAAPPRVLLPMVSGLEEVRQFRRVYQETCDALAAEGVAHRPDLPLGIMVEVPSVALLAATFARHVDFFSVGTNDLTQFALAVDRGNDLVAGLYHELHPAVLGLVRQTVEAAGGAGIPVSVCGEVAADPRVTPLLVGLGVTSLSASPAYLSLVKRVLRAFTLDEAQDLARRALRQPDAASVGRLLDYFLACHNQDLAALLGLDDARPARGSLADRVADRLGKGGEA
ncbi:phosphoenolpyruvate--protein phosphotransferase [Rubrivirga sp. S365]|uniref:Phosphoenolpyruvate-protein phosphotransferase n=1 Tax=Rubrivirga litoralis TaxID=3075598 RepID=A0ABU3BTB4_9BACT|nr:MULTISPECIES: phosphoenolpyruvate--protein phosphotransferase [unclassified Rubrivirga]MDT0632535.1 phosphoenolpyruvate--protein phosphotransferase [Rubrivirga sp. F394]MDT7857000.1 phosphoenolpyruvate--protein phosphotransferase [Rubrivirga sp. S365]